MNLLSAIRATSLFAFWSSFSFACESCIRAANAATSAATPGETDGTFDIAGSETLGRFFSRLFKPDFMPHGHCFWWKPEIVWLHVVSDALIGIAYFSIPLMLFYFSRRRKDLPFHWVFHLFAAFILWCGFTHFLHIYTLWNPIYRFEGVAKAITAAVSVLTAIVLFPLVPQALALRSPRALEAKNQELEKANQKIRESERLKGEFLSNISHELRTPLTLILAPLESMLANATPLNTPATTVSFYKTMHSNAVRLFQLINGLLDLAKLEAEKMEAKREPVDLVALTRSVMEDFQPLVAGRQLEATFETEGVPHYLSVDRYLYERILFNLLSNAIKFTPSQGKILVRATYAGDRFSLSVKDTGIGISAEDQRVLFQRFRQAEGSSTRRYEGTGLGLSLVKEFAILLDGDVSVHSEPGKGSEFTASFACPVVAVPEGVLLDSPARAMAPTQKYFAAPAAVAEERSSSAEDARPKLLVAEDNAELANYIKLVVDSDFRVRVASDGLEAFKIFESWHPDVILSDIMMPGLDGIELCRRVKANSHSGATPVILLTALSDRMSLLKGWENGADEYLFKPFHPAELVTRLRSIVTLAQQRRVNQEAKKRLDELEHFSYIASHDLKEPLRTMKMFGQLLERRCKDAIDDEGREYLQHVISASGRMHELVSDLSVYAELGTRPDKFGPVDLDRLWDQVVEDLGVQIKEAGATLSRADLPTVRGVGSQLNLLLQNLVSNALKFRGVEKPIVRLDVEASGNEWIFRVTDNGIGFQEKYAERIFLVFKRLHDREDYPGTGIGLAISKKIATQHGGRIWAHSTPGKGATFYFSLPRTT